VFRNCDAGDLKVSTIRITSNSNTIGYGEIRRHSFVSADLRRSRDSVNRGGISNVSIIGIISFTDQYAAGCL